MKLFFFFKYFNGNVNGDCLLKYWWYNCINYEYVEYCMKVMMWYGGGKLDEYLDSVEFKVNVKKLIKVKIKGNFFL